MISRAMYKADSANLHRAYWAQFITPAVRRAVAKLDIELLREDFTQRDVVVRNYPLSIWDSMPHGDTSLMVKAGEMRYTPTVAAIVCTAKEAARQRLENEL